MEKKRKPIFVYWLMMIALFVGVLFAQQIVASIMQGSLSTAKFGADATYEILWAGLVLIVVLLFKNKYIFTQKREGFFESFQYIIPELLLSSFFILLSIVEIIRNQNPLNIYALFNLALYCLFIGIVEEFLCRGWLLNEFLERYSQNRKEVFLSIIFSSFIFGVIHFINIGDKQGFFETLVQVMNAAAGGVFLALVYYKTKNIWVVVASHAIWDFSLFLSETNSLGDCLPGPTSSYGIVMNVLRGSVLIAAYALFCYWLYRQTDLYVNENKKPKDYLIGIGVFLYVIGLLFIGDRTAEYMCPDYTRKAIDESYRVSFYDYKNYPVSRTNLVLEEDPDTNQLMMRNTYTEETAYLMDDVPYRNYILVDNKNTFSIIVQTSYNTVLYGKFSKIDISMNENFLEDMKKSFKKEVVPEISDLAIIEVVDDDYYYPSIRTTIGELLYFDSNDKLYMNEE